MMAISMNSSCPTNEHPDGTCCTADPVDMDPNRPGFVTVLIPRKAGQPGRIKLPPPAKRPKGSTDISADSSTEGRPAEALDG